MVLNKPLDFKSIVTEIHFITYCTIIKKIWRCVQHAMSKKINAIVIFLKKNFLYIVSLLWEIVMTEVHLKIL